MSVKYENILYVITPIAVVFLLYLPLGFLFQIQVRYPWIDIPFHLAGGAGVVLSMWRLLMVSIKRKALIAIPRWSLVLLLIGTVALLAVCWEIFEYGMQLLFPPDDPMTLKDTIGDFIVGLLGGIVMIEMIVWYRGRLR